MKTPKEKIRELRKENRELKENLDILSNTWLVKKLIKSVELARKGKYTIR